MYRKIPMWETRIGTRAIGDYSEAFAPKKKKRKKKKSKVGGEDTWKKYVIFFCRFLFEYSTKSMGCKIQKAIVTNF